MDRSTERIRDPIHDLIVFDENDDLDQVAWKLLETPEFQRLRRIKQLGVSEFVYPGATHSRFAHSIGVFHNARRLLDLIGREIRLGRAKGDVNDPRATIAQLAALLHDIGHGPFSHAFEEAREAIAEARQQGGAPKTKFKSHEDWTAEIIENKGGEVSPVLERMVGGGTARSIAELLRAENPIDMYHAVVSSSFDADRLDYIQRDRYMTGTGVARIDLTWLLDNVRVFEIDVSPPSEEVPDPVRTYTFCLDIKGREAAEDFLLARYRLYSNVYLHKTTRGIEQLLTAVFKGVATACDEGTVTKLGLDKMHPLVKFFSPGGETVENYVLLDDGVIWGALRHLACSDDPNLATLSRRILNRDRAAAIDLETLYPEGSERQRRAEKYLDAKLGNTLGKTVFKDKATLTLYGEVGADDERAHKRLMILTDDEVREITKLHETTALNSNLARILVRYYFLDESERDDVREEVIKVTKGRH